MAPHAEIDLRVDGLMRASYKPEATLGDDAKMRAFFERGNAYTVAKLQEKFKK